GLVRGWSPRRPRSARPRARRRPPIDSHRAARRPRPIAARATCATRLRPAATARTGPGRRRRPRAAAGTTALPGTVMAAAITAAGTMAGGGAYGLAGAEIGGGG